MKTTELVLTEEEIKKIKKDFNSGKVFTDGCFCGHALTNFREELYIYIDFSCRKSMSCDNSYYKVTGVYIVEKALKHHTSNELLSLLDEMGNHYDDTELIDGKDFILANSYYEEATIDDIYLHCDNIKLCEDSLKAVQKKLFKYYKKTYGEWSDAKFKDVGLLNY